MKKTPPNPALSPAVVYREAFDLAQNPKTTQVQVRDWMAREAAMLETYGPIVAELACRKAMQEYEEATGLCCTCGGSRHDVDQF